MKKGILFIFQIVHVVAGCSSPEQKTSAPVMEIKKDTVARQVKTLPAKDRQVLTKQRDSLLRNFEYKRKDFSVPTYYHKNWWGLYAIRDHALTAGVDSAGGLFLTACTFLQSTEEYAAYKQTEIKIRIDDSSFYTNSSIKQVPNYFLENGAIERSVSIGAWMPFTSVYMNGAENGVLKKIAENEDKAISFCFTSNNKKISRVFPLSKRDKKGIKDCYQLSLLLKKTAL